MDFALHTSVARARRIGLVALAWLVLIPAYPLLFLGAIGAFLMEFHEDVTDEEEGR